MLNTIWAGLIIISIVFALGHDLADEWSNPYNNGKTIQTHYTPADDNQTITLHHLSKILQARIHTRKHSHELIIPVNTQNRLQLPESWLRIAEHQPGENKTQLRARVVELDTQQQQITFTLPEVHWVKLRAISSAAFDMAEFAVKLAIGLAGIMGLWLGLMRIAEKSGLIFIFVKVIRPLLRWLFPDIPKDHPALGSISLNLAANILGLGNAATPLGIKAMQQLQTLNETKDKASNSMCMFLALNTSSVQLLPPVTLIAIMGTGVSELMIPIILATSASTIAAIIAAKTYARLGNK
ncbi:MAG: nucleoside recognition protein [Gammaproteobacteria bacterium]|nr:nucleoside recognition protein [Gammaproteobacteria bacterium]